MKPSVLQGLGLFEISQTIDKSLRIIFMILSFEDRHLWTPPWVKESYWCLAHRGMAKSHQGADIWTPHLLFCWDALIQTEGAAPFLSTSADSPSFEDPQGGGDGREHFSVCFHL